MLAISCQHDDETFLKYFLRACVCFPKFPLLWMGSVTNHFIKYHFVSESILIKQDSTLWVLSKSSLFLLGEHDNEQLQEEKKLFMIKKSTTWMYNKHNSCLDKKMTPCHLGLPLLRNGL